MDISTIECQLSELLSIVQHTQRQVNSLLDERNKSRVDFVIDRVLKFGHVGMNEIRLHFGLSNRGTLDLMERVADINKRVILIKGDNTTESQLSDKDIINTGKYKFVENVILEKGKCNYRDITMNRNQIQSSDKAMIFAKEFCDIFPGYIIAGEGPCLIIQKGEFS